MLETIDQKYAALSLSGKTEKVHACDISDPIEVKKLSQIIPQPSVIVHCASSNRGGPDAYREIYLGGARNLIDSFPNSRLFFTSSTSVYAQNDGSTVNEDCPAKPERKTSQILRQSEELVLAHGGTILRLSGIYGPERCFHLQRLLDSTATIANRDKSRFLNQIHRDDAASAILHLMQQNKADVRREIYNVTDDHSPTLSDCYAELAHFFNLPMPRELPAEQNKKRARKHRRLSNLKLRGTGWRPTYPTLLDALKNDSALIPSFVDLEAPNQSDV